jgi:hypothetical protein
VRVTVRDLNDWTPAVTVGWTSSSVHRPDVSVQIVPPATTGRRSGVMTTVVHNRSTQPLPLALDGDADALAFGFAADDIVVGPGEELEIDTSVVPTRRTWFRELRHGGLIRVRSDGAPVSASDDLHPAAMDPAAADEDRGRDHRAGGVGRRGDRCRGLVADDDRTRASCWR